MKLKCLICKETPKKEYFESKKDSGHQNVIFTVNHELWDYELEDNCIDFDLNLEKELIMKNPLVFCSKICMEKAREIIIKSILIKKISKKETKKDNKSPLTLIESYMMKQEGISIQYGSESLVYSDFKKIYSISMTKTGIKIWLRWITKKKKEVKFNVLTFPWYDLSMDFGKNYNKDDDNV